MCGTGDDRGACAQTDVKFSTMQDRYAGDIGDYVKLGLLRALSAGRRLGVAWYLHPDEAHNSDGRHIAYLSDPARWRHLDPELFDGLCNLVLTTRSVEEIERTGLLPAKFHREATLSDFRDWRGRAAHRTVWFAGLSDALRTCNIIFADPDNGLVDDSPLRIRDKKHAKQISLREAIALADGRPAIIYHHNTRFKGGHEREVDHWLAQFGSRALAIRATAFSCRTFFILNPDKEIEERVEMFCARWATAKVRLHGAAPQS